MTLVATIIALSLKSDRTVVFVSASILSVLAALAANDHRQKSIRKCEEETKQRWTSNTTKEVRKKSAAHLLHIMGQKGFLKEMTGSESSPERLRSKNVEELLGILDDVCRSEYEGMISKNVFQLEFFEAVWIYWQACHPLIIQDRKQSNSKWNHIFPAYYKYENDKREDNHKLIGLLAKECEYQSEFLAPKI